MITGRHPRDPAAVGDPGAVTARVAALTDAESQQVLQYLAGLSPVTVDMAISTIKTLQLHRDSR
jgi:hypothetical protein